MNTNTVLKGSDRFRNAIPEILAGRELRENLNSLSLSDDKEGEFIRINHTSEASDEWKEGVRKRITEVLGFEPRFKFETGPRITMGPGRYTDAELRAFRRAEQKPKRRKRKAPSKKTKGLNFSH